MKLVSKITLGLATATLLLTGCGGDSAAPAKAEAKEAKPVPTITEEQLSYRNDPLYSEDKVMVPKSKYSEAPATTSTKIERAFQDAPPMIPHDTTGMLPITKGDNQCVQCHMPDVAEGMGATPIPPSHFMNMRPENKVVNGTFHKQVDNLKNQVSIKKQKDLYQGRFNCTQCHAPQSDAKLITENRFQPDYLSADGAHKSHWDKVMTDNLDTLGEDSVVTTKDVENANSPAGESVFKDHH